MKTKIVPENRLKCIEIALLIGLAVFLISGGLALRTQTRLADRVVRLHVLANSDGEEDQALKLLVRDRVLAQATELLTQAKDRTEAETLLREELPELEALAVRELRANGCAYPVTAELTDTEFPTREYDGFTLPAGEYLALRVVIGEGAGRNWWCVVFPPLCNAATTEEFVKTAEGAGLTAEELALLTEESEGVVVRFKVIEWVEGIVNG